MVTPSNARYKADTYEGQGRWLTHEIIAVNPINHRPRLVVLARGAAADTVQKQLFATGNVY